MRLRNYNFQYTLDGPSGTYIQILPTLNVFYSTKHYAKDRETSCTIHIGWIAWMLILHFSWGT